MRKIGIDAFGGDNSPNAIVKASVKFAKENENQEVFLFGDEKKINDLGIELPKNIKIINATEKIESTDEPAFAVRIKKDSSLVVGAKALANDEIDAFISAGNTGALIAAGVFIVKRINGIDRPALPGFLPNKKKGTPTMILDLGANSETKATHLEQYAKMAQIYMENAIGINTPKVGLLNIGAEASKGTDLYKETYGLLTDNQTINFTGNVEARYLLETENDVVVMDGFTGNMVLKTLEGTVAFFNKTLKEVFLTNIKTKLSALLVKNNLQQIKSDLDYKEIGATPILGINKLMLKAHGSSDELAFYNALKKAHEMIDSNFIEEIKKGENNE